MIFRAGNCGVSKGMVTKMKVFGGNGRRENNSGREVRAHRAGGAGGNYIDNYDRGYNNAEAPVRRTAQPRKPRKKGRGWLIALLVIAIIAACVFIYWKVTTRPPETVDIPADAEATPQLTDSPNRVIGRYYTVLVVGVDQLGANTDTIMVARYDAVEHKVNVISIPRDTLVNVPDPVKKINAVYSYATSDDEDGIDALMDEVEGICGFRPDNYVFIDTNVFIQAIDALGGVYFDVPIDMNYDDYADNDNDGVCEYVFTIHVQKGYQLLNGENALGVFRFRQNNNGTGYAMGDIQRLETQHGLIKAVAQQALQLKNAAKLIEIAQLVFDNAQTNLTIGNMQWYAQEFLKMSMDDINISTMPTTGAWINGLSYVTINVDDWINIVNTQLNPFKNPIEADDCRIVRQKNPEPTEKSYTPGNYYTTSGEEVYTNFYKNY